MRCEKRRKYFDLEQMSIEQVEELLVWDFAASDVERYDVDYIMAIMGAITERKPTVGHQCDGAAAWKGFREEYQGQIVAFEHTTLRETKSLD